MILILGVRWWYTAGWLWVARQVFQVRLGRVLEFFSIIDLLKTLFAPFRQDVMNAKGSTLEAKFRILGNNLISRFFGFLIRSALILMGVVVGICTALTALVVCIVWPLIPLTPLVIVVLMPLGAPQL